MKTLYLSDLDGTLLRPDQRTSEYTNRVINRLVSHGAIFSYATARSFSTAQKATEGLRLSVPVIVHNGTHLVDSATGEPLWIAKFARGEKEEIFATFRREGLTPIVYAMLGGRERFSYIKAESGRAQWEFNLTRIGDGREREVFSHEEILAGDTFYFSCIAEEEKLARVARALNGKFRTVFSKDIYSGEFWLEVMPNSASKAHAAKVLKELLGCDKLVCFGDHVNDLPMFEIADECYAVKNARQELKKIATGVIGGNDEDGVAKWLEKNSRIFSA